MNLIVSALVLVGLLFGGSATVAAAQNDLPNEPLYPVKTLSEDVSVWLAPDPITQINRLMEQAQTPTEEMAALAAQGVTPPASLTERARTNIQQALRLTAALDETTMTATLLQIRSRLQTQDQQMARLQDGSCTDCEPILLRTREMLHTQLSQVENGLADPQAFRNANRAQTRTTQTPLATNSTITPQGSCTPVLDGTGQQNGNRNGSNSTPAPQGGTGNENGGNSDSGTGSGSESGSNPNLGGQGNQGNKP